MGAGTHLELLKDSKEARAAEQNEPSREEQSDIRLEPEARSRRHW